MKSTHRNTPTRERKSAAKNNAVVGTFDFETDPFEYGKTDIAPFAAAIWFPDGCVTFWGDDVVQKAVAYLHTLEECELYCHNFGGFDSHFLFEYANREKILIINSKVAKLKIGNVTLIDSLFLLPFSLAEYNKSEIDYRKFTQEHRETHKAEILDYCQSDCKNLYEVVTGFHKLLGKKLTIASASIKHIEAERGQRLWRGGEKHDDIFRRFFFGGRVEAFRVGHFTDTPFVYVDVNSAYPYAMIHEHPHGPHYSFCIGAMSSQVVDQGFYRIIAISRGAFPYRDDSDGFQVLTFPDDDREREYFVTGWELNTALRLKLVDVKAWHESFRPLSTINFKEFVKKFYKLKADSKGKDAIAYLAYKYLLNSGYGKLAINPREFREYEIFDVGEYNDDMRERELKHEFDVGTASVWSASAYDGKGFVDVATAASVTGFQRAKLMEALAYSNIPIYCDTDCVVAESVNVKYSKNLGDWSVEGRGTELAIAGKKLYAAHFVDENGLTVKWKIASKGARLTESEIIQVARGNAVEWRKESPSFSLRYGQRAIKRIITRKKPNGKT